MGFISHYLGGFLLTIKQKSIKIEARSQIVMDFFDVDNSKRCVDWSCFEKYLQVFVNVKISCVGDKNHVFVKKSGELLEGEYFSRQGIFQILSLGIFYHVLFLFQEEE